METNELLRLQKRIERLGSLSGLVTYEYHPATGKLSWGKSLEHVLGYTTAETDGTVDQWLHWIHPEDRDNALRQLEAAERNLSNYNVEYRLLHKNGEYITIRDRGFFIMDETDSQTVEMIGLVQDVTDEKKAQIALLESEIRFGSLLQQAPFDIQIYQVDGLLVEANQAWIELFHTIPAYIGKYNIFEDPQVQQMGLDPLLRRTIQGETVITDEIEYVPEKSGYEGRARWLYGRYFPLRNSHGEVTHFVMTHVDITERRKIEAEHQRLQEEIIAAQQRSLKELSTPIIPIMDQIIVMPLVGSIDSLRARDLTRSLLEGITLYHARVVILDITGVPLVDSGVANHLNKTIQAARLKGARAIVTGISDAVAETMVDLGLDWSAVETQRDLQSGLRSALNSLGIRLSYTNTKD